MPKITYRPAVEADFELLLDLHRQAMRVYVEQTWGVWDEVWQRERFVQNFSPANTRIIQVDGENAGCLSLEQREAEIYIGNISLFPQFQGRGIGTQMIRKLQADAAAQQKSVSLQVLKVNPAHKLYERLGFVVTGETETHFQMRSTTRSEA